MPHTRQQPRQLRPVHPREPLHEFGDMCPRLRLVVLDERIFAPFPIPLRAVGREGLDDLSTSDSSSKSSRCRAQ